MERDDNCGCVKSEGQYGRSGWHWRPSNQHPDWPQADVVVERCPRYSAAVVRGEREA